MSRVVAVPLADGLIILGIGERSRLVYDVKKTSRDTCDFSIPVQYFAGIF